MSEMRSSSSFRPLLSPKADKDYRRDESLFCGFRCRCCDPRVQEYKDFAGASQMNVIQDFVKRASVPYRKENQVHEKTLKQLWNCAFPATNMTARISKGWRRLGFQGDDPATDFRSCGYFGLECLLYFAKMFPDILQKHLREDYPFACCALNVHWTLMCRLRLTRAPPRVSPDCGTDIAKPSPTSRDDLRCFCWILYGNPSSAFQEIFCLAVQIMNEKWKEMKERSDHSEKDLLMFNQTVLPAVWRAVEEVLLEEPVDLMDFKGALQRHMGFSLMGLK